MPAESFGTSLFPVDQIDKLLEHTHIRYVGGMTGYKLDALTDCPESNRYHTGMTLGIFVPEWKCFIPGASFCEESIDGENHLFRLGIES